MDFGPRANKLACWQPPCWRGPSLTSVGGGGCEQQNRKGRWRAQAQSWNGKNIPVDLGKKTGMLCTG